MSKSDYSAQVFGPGQPPIVYPYQHGALGDEKEVILTLYKQSDFELFHQGEILTPERKIAALRDCPPGFICALDSTPERPILLPYDVPEWHEWVKTPLQKRRLPFLTFDLAGWVAEVTHQFRRGNYWQYARLTAPDGRVWLGVSGYLDDQYKDPELPPGAARELYETFGLPPNSRPRAY